MELSVRRRRLLEERRKLRKRITSIEVIRIDGGERLLHDIAGSTDGMRGSPGFGAICRNGERLREVVDILEAVFNGKNAFVFRTDLLLEFGLEILADDEHNLAESCAVRVENGIVEDSLSGRTDRIDLLQSAIAGPHACCENYECRFHI